MSKPVIVVDVVNRIGGIGGAGPITSCLSLDYTYERDGAGSFSAVFAAGDPRLATVVLKNSYLDFTVNSRKVFRGVVQRRKRTVKRGVKSLTISGTCQLGVLAETQTGQTLISDGASGPSVTALEDILATSVVPNQLFIANGAGYATTLKPYYKQLAGESTLKALVDMAEDLGEHFRAPTPAEWEEVGGVNSVVWLRLDTPDAPIRLIADGGQLLHQNGAVALIEELTVDENAERQYNKVYVYGAGNGAARLNLAASSAVLSDPDYDVDRAASSITYLPATGLPFTDRVTEVEFKQLRVIENTDDDLESASNALLEAGYNWLRRCADPAKMRSYRLKVRGLPDSVTVGMKIHVAYAESNFEIDEDLIILSIARSVDEKALNPAILVVVPYDWYEMSEAGRVAQGINRAKVYSAHPQTIDNSNDVTYRVYVGEDQADDKAEIHWFFGDEIVRLRRILLRFKLGPLVTFTGSVGGTAFTSGSGGAAVVTSTSYAPVTTHVHELEIKETVAAPAGDPLYIDPVEGLGAQTGTDQATQMGLTASADLPLNHDHDVDIPPHSHPVDISGAITNSFGIFRASSGDTFGIDDLEYAVNGGAWADLNTATAAGAGYYKLDLTALLMDATTRRPLQETNELEIRRKAAGATGKTGMLDVMLNILSEVQAIEYS